MGHFSVLSQTPTKITLSADVFFFGMVGGADSELVLILKNKPPFHCETAAVIIDSYLLADEEFTSPFFVNQIAGRQDNYQEWQGEN